MDTKLAPGMTELRAPGQYHVIRPNIADRGVPVGVVVDGLASDPL